MKGKIRNVLRDTYGEYKTNLEGEYRDKVIEVLLSEDIKDKREWATYNQVVVELKHNIKDSLKTRELLYRLTDKEDPNSACIDVIKEIKKRTPELERLYHKIINFVG